MKEFRLINSIHVKRVPIDDRARALYTHGESGERNFYGGVHPQPNSLTTDKILYTFYPKSAKAMGVLIFLEKFGQEWTLVDEAKLETFTHMGKPVSFYFKEETNGASTSKGTAHVDFADKPRETPFSPKKEPTKRKSELDTSESKGHLGGFGPIGPGGSSGSKRFTSMMGFPTGKGTIKYPRKTRPSNFQKWIKKYNGVGDPFDHLATFNHNTCKYIG